MSQTAEEAILARIKGLTPPPLKFYSEYHVIYNSLVTEALSTLQKKDWPGGDIARVAITPSGNVQQVAIWKLTTLMYLTSNGKICIKVLDPRKQLGYEFAEVDIDYLLANHANPKTVRAVQEALREIGAE